MRGRARMFRGRPSGWARLVRWLRSLDDGAAAAGALLGTAAAAALIYFLL